MGRFLKLMNEEKGQSTVMIAIIFVVIMGFTSLAVDIGLQKSTKAKLQTVADAAALAGAQLLPNVINASNQAIQLASQNGLSTSNIQVITPNNNEISQLKVICTEQIKYSFATVLGFENSTVSATATAQKKDIAGAFEYAIFTEESATFNGSGMYVIGSIHSNNSFTLDGANHAYVDGNIEAVGDLTLNGPGVTITGSCQGANVKASAVMMNKVVNGPAKNIPMLDMSETLINKAKLSGSVYNSSQTFLTKTIDVNQPIYVDGSLNLTDCRFEGNGSIIVSGDINLGGNNLTNIGSSVTLYSLGGTIDVLDNNTKTQAILYSPNGNIILHQSQEIEGRIIAKSLTFNGFGSTVKSSLNDLNSLPKTIVTLIQ
ncbi:MAG: hypothetical protein K0R18_872 [Bacillales bacterium]|jgi:Flp pilus assembly protein TadG|nr:hypothetical protein [Bacillales bacterium]